MIWAQKRHIVSLQVMEEWHDAQNQLSGERNARILQEGILANHLAKQKQKEMADKEMNS